MPTEKEFLAQYDIGSYQRPSVTTDVVAFMIRSEDARNYRQNALNRLSILLVRRGQHPYKDAWALPGGFLQPGETVEACALREIREETNVLPASLMPVGIFSEPGRDPRGWIISAAYASVISESSVTEQGGDDAAEAGWFDISLTEESNGAFVLELMRDDIRLQALLREKASRFGHTVFEIEDRGDLAFDRAGIIASALTALREDAKNYDVIFDFLPEKFTLTALQKVQETIMNISVLTANFRRKITDYVEETDEYTQGAGHRPAKLYRRK